MRIIAGTAKGRRLATPGGKKIRPTTDRIRESLFSILGDLEGTIVVDGFAGTGALGCEALSRGARRVYFFERWKPAIALVRENVERVDAVSRARVWHCSFSTGLEKLNVDPDLFLLDPPYGTDDAEKAIRALEQSERVTEGALIVVEQATTDAEIASEIFESEDVRVYGNTRLTFFRR